MICVYRGTGPTDAYLVRDWLEENGLRVAVFGEALMGAMGELPIGDSWPSVWVRESDRERALAALQALKTPQLVHPEWTCVACGETCPANFASCWNCGADQPPSE